MRGSTMKGGSMRKQLRNNNGDEIIGSLHPPSCLTSV